MTAVEVACVCVTRWMSEVGGGAGGIAEGRDGRRGEGTQSRQQRGQQRSLLRGRYVWKYHTSMQQVAAVRAGTSSRYEREGEGEVGEERASRVNSQRRTGGVYEVGV